MTDRTPASAAEVEELERLRSEVSRLRGELETQRRRGSRTLAVRKVIAAVLVVVAAFGAVSSVIGIWAARTALNTDRWVSTVTPLPQDPEVANAVSTYVTREVLRVLDVRDRIAGALPSNAAFLAAPLTGAMDNYVRRTVDDVLQTPQFANLWVGLNRTAHAQIVAVLDNRSEVVKTGDGTVTLNLLPIVNNVLSTLEQKAPTLFGKQVALPELTSGTVPANLRTRVESALGVQLPEDFANVVIYTGDEVGALQDAVRAFKRYLALLIVGTLAALGLALWISPARRRKTLQLGIWLIIATVALTALLRAVRGQILGNAPEGVYRNGAASALTIVFSTLRERAGQLLVLGVLVALIAYLGGPGRGASWVRQQVVTGWQAVTRGGKWLAADRGRRWIRANLDVLRIGGVVVAAIVALLLSSWASLLVVLILLAAYETFVTFLARAGPPVPTAEPGEPEPRTVVLPGPRRDDEKETDVAQTTEPEQKMRAT